MPKAVSDAGPLIHLAQIGRLHLVKKLFHIVSITPKVKREAFDEGVKLGHPDAQILGKALDEGWIMIENLPESLASASESLAEGEGISLADAETLMLAREKAAEILVDEKALSDLAKMYGLKVWSTWTILLESLRKGFIRISDIDYAIKELGEKRHKLKDKQAEEILEAARFITSRRRTRETKAPPS